MESTTTKERKKNVGRDHYATPEMPVKLEKTGRKVKHSFLSWPAMGPS